MGSDKPVFKMLDEPQDSCCVPSGAQTESACCGPSRIAPVNWDPPDKDLPFAVGEIDTPVGKVPQVSSDLTWSDRMGTVRARWGFGRMSYAIPPGLYALGTPDAGSHVLVTANYKLSFDKLRGALPGQNFWILVLDTFGINVWCAAGKGTFGTDELAHRIAHSRLDEVVEHRRVIVPQLGAPGVAAHTVKKLSGFKVIYGPIRAEDLPAFVDARLKATPDMRRKSFSLSERTVLIPIELVSAFKGLVVLAAGFFFASGLGGPGDYWSNALDSGLLAVAALFGVLLGGVVLTPIMLPWLPGRAFSVKSVPVALALAALAILWFGSGFGELSGGLEAIAWLLIVPALTAFLAMNFTGASTYTSLSGVKKEMRFAVPAQVAGASVGLILWIVSRITA
jgi:acetyl-CoA decarbonylase/synthase complex subunit gamma